MLTEGDVFKIEPGDRFYTRVPKHFGGDVGNWELSQEAVQVYLDDWTNMYIGEYIVTKTAMDGGGTAHGPHDIYPDGHHVWAENANNKHLKIDFYQSGAFTAMMPNKTAHARATASWKIEKNEP